MVKIVRAATLGTSLDTFCEGILQNLKNGILGFPCEIVALASPDEDLQKLALREDVRTIGVPMERHISLFKDLSSLWQLYRVFRSEKPDMVHSMTPKAGLLCMIAAWLARVPVRVHTFTGLVWPTATGMTRKILMTTDWITCACATHIIPEGQGVLNDLKNHGITKKPMKVLGYGNVRGIDLTYWKTPTVPLNETEERSQSSIEKPFTFLFVGRIVGDKGINELVSAFWRLLSQRRQEKSGKEVRSGRDCQLVLVGRYEDNLDPISPETRRLIDSTPEIMAVGPKYGDELLSSYAAADCFVFPSYREGFPNTVLEAGAMELASIVTDINGSREIVCKADNHSATNYKLQDTNYSLDVCENGVVIPSKDTDALFEAMLWMLEHEEERRQMGKRAREIVAERYEQGFVREKLYEFYREVLPCEE